jgi:hypothetical protein
MGQPLVYPENAKITHILKMIISTAVILCILFPFIYGTLQKLKKEIVFVIDDDFVPCFTELCFNGGIQESTWSFEMGDGSQYSNKQRGWGNNELQCYTDKYANAHVEPNPEKKGDGMLVISAIHNQNASYPDCKWTSSRLVTKGKKLISWQKDIEKNICVSARIEARIKLPMKNAAWSAFWMLPEPPKNNKTCLGCGVYGGWCNSGEIDIMEHRDVENKVIGTARFNDTYGCANNPQYSQPLDMDKWNIFSIEWTCTHIKWYINGILFKTHTSNNKFNKPFDQLFYIILNLAVGGDFPNNKIEEVTSRMYIDYIKAYYV